MARIDLDVTQINRMLRLSNGPVGRHVYNLGRRTRTAAKNLAPKWTGALAGSIVVRRVRIDVRPAVRVGSDLSYARFPHDGTGIYGPYGRPIHPRRAKALAFYARSGYFVVTPTVKGQPGTHYLTRALRLVVR